MATTTAAEAGGEGALQPQHDLSGVWQVIPTRSDGLNDFLAELGVGFMARKIVCGVQVTTTITHTCDRYILVDSSSLGQSKSDLKIDGKPHQVKDEKGKKATMTCSSENGIVKLTSVMPDMVTVTKEERMLESRSVLRQTVDVFKNGKHRMRLTRHFARQETDAERAAGEKKWIDSGVEPRANLLANTNQPTSSSSSPNQHQHLATAAAASTATNSSNDSKDEMKAASNGTTSGTPDNTLQQQQTNPSPSSTSEQAAVMESIYGSGAWTAQGKPHPYVDISGVWVVIPSKEDSEALDTFLKELNVGYVARKVVCSLNVVTTIALSNTKYVITDASKLGPPKPNEFILDGQERLIKDGQGKETKVKAVFNHGVNVWSWPSAGITTWEERFLESRTVYRQVVDVIKAGKRTFRLERRFTRQETEDEKASSERAWREAGLDVNADCMALRKQQLALDSAAAVAAKTSTPATNTTTTTTTPPQSSNADASSSSSSSSASSSTTWQNTSGVVSMVRSPVVPAVAITVQAAAPVSTLMFLLMVLLIVHSPHLLLACIIVFLVSMIYLGDRILSFFGEQDFVVEKEARRRRDQVIAQLRWMNVTLDSSGNPTYAGSSDMPIPSATRGPRERDRRVKMETALTQMSAMGLVRPNDQ